jgi:DnaJ-class molecular chaperone
MPTGIDPLEVAALARIMEELDYYELLAVEPTATTAEIRRAYHASSRNFHPDANRHLGQDLRDHCGRIAKRVTEAYCVLRDTRRRRSYDARRGQTGGLRIQLAEARSSHIEQRRAEIGGATPQGRQFHAKAEAEAKAGNLAGAIQHLRMALTLEPANTGFKARIDAWKRSEQTRT